MRDSRIRERWAGGEPAVSGWCSIGNAYLAEIMGHSGVDCVTVDLQHGMIDIGSLIMMLQAISSTPATPLVRLPDGDAAPLMKALDAGAYGVICPMIDSVDQAAEFVAATRFPPRGIRSFGPARGLLYGGADYFDRADQLIVRLAMIETSRGLEAVEAICAVEGLDGVFIGPADLGLSLGRRPAIEPEESEVNSAIDHCLRAATHAGKHAGIFCASGASAGRRIGQGFDFVVINSDSNLLKAVLSAELRACSGEPSP